ncbi:MAG: RDD family protein [bacterium]|nr:RDD family protein [bacterium]
MKEKDILIETPEKIRFSYTIAELGIRMIGYFLDLLIQMGITILLGVIIVVITIGSTFSGLSSSGHLAIAFYLIINFILRWFYFVFFEVIMEGQTPGKRAMKIRVIKASGEHLDFETIVVRNLLRAVDGFPGIPIMGGIIALIDKRSRRLGDIAGNTIVVNEINFNLKEPNFSVTFSQEERGKRITIQAKLNEHELYILRRFLNEKKSLSKEKEQEIALKLAKEVQERLQSNEPINNPVQYLEQVYKEHGS